MPKIATPISHLFEEAEIAQMIQDASDCLECRDKTFTNNSLRQELFHCELEPIHKLNEKDFQYLEQVKNVKKELKLITFHMASSCSEPKLDKSKIKSGMFTPAGHQYSKDEMISNAKYNLQKIKTIFGNNIKIAVENNNYYPTEAYKYITDPDFISKVVHNNDISFLFDIAHAQVTSHNQGIKFNTYKSSLPLDKIVQLHICSPSIDLESKLAYDAHNYPDELKLKEVEKLIKQYPRIEYLTVEYYRDIENLIKSINELKNVCNI